MKKMEQYFLDSTSTPLSFQRVKAAHADEDKMVHLMLFQLSYTGLMSTLFWQQTLNAVIKRSILQQPNTTQKLVHPQK